jgi:hypothetical protein
MPSRSMQMQLISKQDVTTTVGVGPYSEQTWAGPMPVEKGPG